MSVTCVYCLASYCLLLTNLCISHHIMCRNAQSKIIWSLFSLIKNKFQEEKNNGNVSSVVIAFNVFRVWYMNGKCLSWNWEVSIDFSYSIYRSGISVTKLRSFNWFWIVWYTGLQKTYIYQIYIKSVHFMTCDLETSNQSHCVFIGLYIITMYMYYWDSRAVRPRGFLFSLLRLNCENHSLWHKQCRTDKLNV